MTTFLVALAALACGPASPPAQRTPVQRVERHLVDLRVVRDLDRDGARDLCVFTRTAGRVEIAAYSAAQGRELWRADGPVRVADWSSGPLPGALAALGDHDGDGVGEIAALWPDTDSAGEVYGAVLAVHSGADGHVLREIAFAAGLMMPSATTLAATGDLDGDWLPDILVLAPARDLASGWFAAISSASGATLWRTPTAAHGDAAGASIALLRDVDGDGLVDAALVVANGVDVLSGRDGHVVKRIENEVMNPATESATWRASGALVVMGDLDRDGIIDLLVPQRELALIAESAEPLPAASSIGSACCSALGLPRGETPAGGEGTPPAPPHRIGHATAGALVSVGRARTIARHELPVWALELSGASFLAAGDFDGDQRIDILCCDPGWNLPREESLGGVDVGAVCVLSGADAATLRVWHGGTELAHLGRFAALAGDVDGDGTIDVWMSAVDTSARPREVLGLASGKTGEFLRWIDLGIPAVQSPP
jgi:hypothetical protein